jgi:hypothetical protein
MESTVSVKPNQAVVFNPKQTEFHFGKEITTYELEVAYLVLNKMFTQDPFFNICDVDAVAEMFGVRNQLGRVSDYNALRALHCVWYKTMSKSVMDQTVQKTYGMFGLAIPGSRTVYLDDIVDIGPNSAQNVKTKTPWWNLLK